MILIGIDPRSWASTKKLEQDHDCFWRAVGLHPNSVEDIWEPELESRLRQEVRAGGIVAVGETGVDLYRSESSKTAQMDAFDIHIQIAKDSNLPIVIHQRSAEDAVLDVLGNHGQVSGVMHCFGGGPEFATRCLDIGLHLGIGGVATFRRSDETRQAIVEAPLGRLVLETDAPFLAPQPVRGKRNEPSFLPYVAETIAECKGLGVSDVEHGTTRNAAELFGLGI